MKALREGRTPTPGAPGEESSDNLPSISEFPSPPSNFTAPLPHQPDHTPEVPQSPPQFPVTPQPTISQPAVPAPQTPSPPAALIPQVAPIPQAAPISQISTPVDKVAEEKVAEEKVASAQKNARWAISALDYEDIKTARLQLLLALNNIGFNQENNFGY